MRPSGYFRTSRQTSRTKRVREFAYEVVPKGTQITPKEVGEIVAAIKDRLRIADHHEIASGNTASRRLKERITQVQRNEFHPQPGGMRQYGHLIHLSVPGVRTADEILRDGFVSKAMPCTDYNTTLMAVLRCHGVPCRLVRFVDVANRKQSSLTEAVIDGKEYRIFPLMEGSQTMQKGPVRETPGYFFYRAKDHHSSGFDVRRLACNLSAERMPVGDAIEDALG